MIRIQCQKCHRRVIVEDDWNTSATCENCGGDFKEIEQKIEQKISESEYTCGICKEGIDNVNEIDLTEKGKAIVIAKNWNMVNGCIDLCDNCFRDIINPTFDENKLSKFD